MNFKKVLAAAAAFFSILLISGCSVSLGDDNSQSVQYGSVSVTGASDRGIDYSGITTCDISVSGTGITTPVTKTGIAVTNGAASSVQIDQIPVGTNRIITVKAMNGSTFAGYTITAISDITADKVTSVTVSWDSTKVGNVFTELLSSNYDISSITKTQIDSIKNACPSAHPNLIDTKKIAEDFKSGSISSSADSYLLSSGTVTISATNLENHSYTYKINDPSVEDASVPASGSIKVTPGTKTFSVYDAGTFVKSAEIIVKSGKTTTVTITGSAEGTVDTSKIAIHVPTSNGQSKIYAWTGSGTSATKLAGEWPGTAMTDSDGDGYYDYSFASTVDSCSIIFDDGNSDAEGSKGNHQTNNLVSPAKGEWKYTGGKAGTGTSSDWEAWGTSSIPFSLTVENPVAAKVSLTTSGTFTSTKSVTVTATSCTTSKYTIDGTDPKTSSTAVSFTDSATVSVGSSASIGDVITVKVYGTDGEDEATASAEFTKVKEDEKPATPTRLGAYYRSTDTQFTIWSPDSSNVKVAVKKAGESDFTTYTCTAGYTVNGDYSDTANIYGVKVDGDCKLAEYQFSISGKPVRDPYGRMIKYEDADAKTNVIKSSYAESNCTVTSYAGSSINIVMDVDSIEMSDSQADRPALADRSESVVYEIHVGDFTSHSSWNGTSSYKGKFEGLTESGTTYTSGSTTVKTGLDHLVELGVTHVQIMPMYDYATKYNETLGEYYNWGYDPVNYNVPEDRFSVDPTDYEGRIREVKDMVNKLHAAGIRVIMDVVYNHTFDGEMFNKISSEYYTTTDRSGCGNSVNVSNAMVSRMVRDSLEYWLDTFNFDGFRFDLMGIYTTSAMSDWGTYLNNKFSDRSLLLYGEPYQANNDDTSGRVYASALPSLSGSGIGGFAHKYRETLKGDSDGSVKGYIFNSTAKDGDSTVWNTQVGLKGSGTGLGSDSEGVWTRYFTSSPFQAVNYLAAHDNLCLYDKIVACGVTTSNSAYQQAIVKFGHGIITLSQGVGFIHGGDDFLRTKSGGKWSEFLIDSRTAKENSYMFGQEMNCIDWSRKATYYNTFKYHKDLIAFKKAHNGFWNGSASTSADGMVIYYTVKDSDGTTLTCVLNPGDNITYSGSGTKVFDGSGAVSSSSDKTCQGTAVTIFKN